MNASNEESVEQPNKKIHINLQQQRKTINKKMQPPD